MDGTLPPLRQGLDIMPSPLQDHPGALIRDPFRYSEAILVIPPVLVLGLPYFDGEHTVLDIQAELTRRTGQIAPREAVDKLVEALNNAGFLETEAFFAMREQRQIEFRAAKERSPAHAGAAYPEEPEAARSKLQEYFAGAVDGLHGGSRGPASVLGLAAPHVSPDGGWNSYVAAYRTLTPDLAGRTFVLLGTSHYGEPEKFGLTRKPYVTPLGKAEVDTALVDELAARAPQAVIEEDYCHAVEHSIEFQALFLQYAMPQPVKVLPILCGPFRDSLASGRRPEQQDTVRAFLEALGEIAARHGRRLFWLLGIDMAHVGMRYGDDLQAVAGRGAMVEVERRDRERLERVCAGDSAAFFDLVRPRGDDLKWCGYSPLYTFLRAVPQARGSLLRYEQWNIDPQSVVSFGGLEFFEPGGSRPA
jgi:AmmeMemoRadiSam system protein B